MEFQNLEEGQLLRQQTESSIEDSKLIYSLTCPHPQVQFKKSQAIYYRTPLIYYSYHGEHL